MHTHLFMPSLGDLGQWGIDDLVTYHYIWKTELFRSSKLRPAEYWAMSKQDKADAIWRALFVENSPVSEATRGVIAVLNAFGLPTQSDNLREARQYFAGQKLSAHIDHVFSLAGISDVVMTNDPLDPAEGPLWEQGAATRGSTLCFASIASSINCRITAACSSRKAIRWMRSAPQIPEAKSGGFYRTGADVCVRCTWRFRCRIPLRGRKKVYVPVCWLTRVCLFAVSSTFLYR